MPDITKISHGLTIGDLKFGNARPGIVEATLKPGETMEDALDELDERLNAWHRKRYPHLYQEPVVTSGYIHSKLPTQEPMTYTPQIISVEKEPEERTIGIAIADIYSCESLKVLETYRLMSKSKPELQAAYTQRFAKLSKVESK